MRKINLLVLLIVLFLAFPISGLAVEDEAAEPTESGMVDPSEAQILNPDFLKDERVINLENEYEAHVKALSDQIQNESDALARERLQEQVQNTKAEQEIVVKEMYLNIAIEQGDEDLEMQISKDLEMLYETKVAQPASQEPQQKPDSKSKKTKISAKNPDDA